MMVTSRDIDEIVSKLSSEKAKTREEGIKLLNTWMEGERSVAFCKYLKQKTAKLKQDEIPSSGTWPYLISLLIRCVSEEVSASKRRLPKLSFAKALRAAVQRAQDVKSSGTKFLLLSVAKSLFNHILDTLRNVPSFQSEYGIILRHLLAARGYCFHMRKRTYCNLVLLYMEKVDTSLSGKDSSEYNPNNEVFRCISTLHSLLENPPGDFPDDLRKDIVKGFVRIFEIFSYARDEGKVSRKLIECVNTYLLKDGPNLGFQSLELHGAMQQFVFRCWVTTHDRGLKDALTFYARLQINLTRGAADGSTLVEQFFDVVCRELDQINIPSSGMSRNDIARDEKHGTLSNSQHSLVELAAIVFYRACVHTFNASASEKRVKREHASAHLKHALTKGKWLWNAAFCNLLRCYGTCINRDLLIYWFEGICLSFGRILNDANVGNAYDGLLWTLRSLQELSSILLLPDSTAELSSRPDIMKELGHHWQTIWSSLMHGLLTFSNVTAVADAALMLLGSMISSDLISVSALPNDIWDLQLFKKKPSVSLLYFISCYFSKKCSQGNLQEMLQLRKNLLRTVLSYLNWKESPMLNEHMVLLFPAALYAVSAGCAPFTHCYKELPLFHSFIDATQAETKTDAPDEIFNCSVEVLAKIHSSTKEDLSSGSQSRLHLPRQFTDLMLHEMEIYLLGAQADMEMEKIPLADVFFICALFANFIYGSYIVRQREERCLLISKICELLAELLDHAFNIIQEHCNSFQEHGCLGSDPIFEGLDAIVTSFRSFVCSPTFIIWRDENVLDDMQCSAVLQSLERVLKALARLYEQCSVFVRNLQCARIQPDLTVSDMSTGSPDVSVSNKSRIMDVELDMDNAHKDADILTVGGNITTGTSFSVEKWKFGMIELISRFFPVLHVVTSDVLFDLLEKEYESEASEYILYNLCKHPYWSSSAKITGMVNIMNKMLKTRVNLKLDCFSIINAIHGLLGTLISFSALKKDKLAGQSVSEREFEQILVHIGDLLNKVAEFDLLNWFGRVRLIECICNFVILKPQIGQIMIERLLLMLRDPDYRVRFSLARRIGVLFQTWDGHDELFQDICSNFGVTLVLKSREKLVSAADALAAGPQPRPAMETVIITLMNLALHSEKVELEAIFMICVVSAIDCCHRELVNKVLDNLSRQLDYASRQKYLDQLMGSIIFCWIACGVSLVALVEIRQLFVLDAEPGYFVQYCCHWLLPALILHDNRSNLKWAAQISGQPLAALVRNHFVPIFSVCITLHCSKGSGKEKGAIVLQKLILDYAEISEIERDKLIKKHMVSIVSQIFSLASNAREPSIPCFSKDTVASAIQAVVDGFLEMEDFPKTIGVVDRVNIFRPDRVFMFIVEMHYNIESAIHHRHKYHRLAGIEVLVNILEHRAAVASTSNYLLSLIGQFIGCHALQEQCCRIISSLLRTLKSNLSEEVVNVLGEQLQFLVSNLVSRWTPPEASDEDLSNKLYEAVFLLHQLTVDSDPSLHEYVQELEPFPELDVFARIREFQQELCRAYSPREHLLKFVKKSCHLPPKLLKCSLQALHRKLLMGVTVGRDMVGEGQGGRYWDSDKEIVNAVWTLVRMCGLENLNGVRELVSDFLSKIGIGDPHCVVFHLPGDSCQPIGDNCTIGGNLRMDTGICGELMIALLKLLKKYRMDDSAKVVDITSQALRGILSTERGQRALVSFDSYETSLLEVHSKGVNGELVEKILLELEKKSNAEAVPLDKCGLWETHDKTFDLWICPLVYSLICYCNDVIVRLCQDIVLLKSEVAELLLPSVIVNLAGRKDLDVDLHKLISLQVQEHIFVESNKLIKSVQVWLNALNELRLCHVMERSSLVPSKRESSKYARPSSSSSKSRSSLIKGREVEPASSLTPMSTSLWVKVYWLSIDYLIVARSANMCGSYLTSVLYVEHWCEEHFNGLTLGSPDFSHQEVLPLHIEILISAVTHVNEPDSLYGIVQSYKLTSQIVTLEHEGNWSKALEYYDLQVRLEALQHPHGSSRNLLTVKNQPTDNLSVPTVEDDMRQRKPYKGLIRSLQRTGCTHVLDLYCQGLTSREGEFQCDEDFIELQYEAAWRTGNWDFGILHGGARSPSGLLVHSGNFNENLHSCLRALLEGDYHEFRKKLKVSKQELVRSLTCASKESTEYIYSMIIRLQILYHLGMAWDLRWKSSSSRSTNPNPEHQNVFSIPIIPNINQLSLLNKDWTSILKRTQLHISLLEPFIAFRRVLLQILNCKDCTVHHLLQSAATLRKGSRFSQAAAALHEFKLLSAENGETNSSLYWMGRIEEAKLLRAQGQHEMAINLAKYIVQNSQLNVDASDLYRLVGKWLAETRSSNSGTILEKYLKPAVSLAESNYTTQNKSAQRQSQAHFQLAHYADALFRSYEERLNSNEWQAAMRLRKHKTIELEALIKRLKSSTKGEKTDYSNKIQELQKQLAMDKEEAEKLQEDRDNFLKLALQGYKRCLVVGEKYDARVVFRLVSLWFSLSSRQSVIDSMLCTIQEVQSYKFVPLVYQIASRMGSTKDGQGPHNFQFALVSLVKKMAIDHPYHTIFQLFALANGDRIKDKQRSKSSFVVDYEKKLAAENLLEELSSYHGPIIEQMKQMVEIYIRLAELETRREDTNKKVALPRDIRNLRQLELVPVVTATFPIDRSCQYPEGSFPYFRGMSDSVVVMNGINAPKVVECFGSDGHKYRQLAKSGNDDLRQDAVMEQFFGFVNTFLQNHRDTWKRRLNIRTYKVVPFTPSAGVIEWVDGTVPLGEYLIGSTRTGGAHGRYGMDDWFFLKCREHMTNEKDKRKAFQEVCKNFRPVMHHFFLERFSQPADWFERRLAYTRSVATSSMVGYIVGLGDRHAMNILIDQATAEVVHIDLGVAFEQGFMLKTPERVPFRLTRDIVDGMGVTGVEGVFRRCCEETLSVMRMNKEALLTIVEVFLHDPLYKWALSPLKALRRQKETDDDLEMSLEGSEDEVEGNKDAARALIRVKQKLDGYEGGEMRSVNGQVQQLIQDAIDPDRLCHMFPGWGAWL